LLKKPFEATAMIDTLRPLMDVAAKAREKRKPKPVDAPEEKTVRLHAPIVEEEHIPTPAPVEAMEVPPEVADIPFGMDVPQEPAASHTPEIDLASVEFAMPGVEPTESAEVTIPTEFQESAPAAPPAPAPEAVVEETPPPAAEPAPEPAPAESVYGVEPALEVPAEAPAEVPAEVHEVVVEEAAPPALAEPEPEPPAPPPAPEATPHWVAEPAEVTKQDQAVFEPAGAAAPAPPENPPDWNELLKSVEEPAVAATVATAAAAVAAKEEEPVPTPPPPSPSAPLPAKVDEDAVRTAVQLCLESALPTLIEDITASVIRRLNK
jgi:nicotinate-nucleotide--dimethylbenzimidazole phosphoribosyltransferase